LPPIPTVTPDLIKADQKILAADGGLCAVSHLTGPASAQAANVPIISCGRRTVGLEAKAVIERVVLTVAELLATNNGSFDFHMMNVKAAIVVLGRVASRVS